MYLIYEETELSGVPGCRTRLKCKPDEVQMKRFGEGAGIGNEIRFERGKRYSGLYDTPFGAIEMEVLTNKLENNLTEEGGGNLDIDYSISLKRADRGPQPAEHNIDVKRGDWIMMSKKDDQK